MLGLCHGVMKALNLFEILLKKRINERANQLDTGMHLDCMLR